MKTALVFLSLTVVTAQLAAGEPVSFTRDVAPILARRCLGCHGAKKARGRFRLDTFARLVKPGRGGARLIVPGAPDESEFIRLITSSDEDERMPLDDDPLSAPQVATIRAWIAAGASFDGASRETPLARFVSPRRPRAPPETYRVAVPVLAVAISPDGDEIAAGGYHEVTIWSLRYGALRRRIAGLPERIEDLAYTRDGLRLIAGGGTPGESGEVTLLDPLAGRVMRRLHSSSDIVTGVALSPDDSLVAVGSADRTVGVARIASGERLWTAKVHSDAVTGVAFSHDGSLVASSSKDMTVKVYRAAGGDLYTTHRGHNRNIGKYAGHFKVFDVAFDPDGPQAVSAGEGPHIHVWDPAVIKKEDGTAADLEERFRKEASVRRIAHGYGVGALRLLVRDGRVFSTSPGGVVREHRLSTLELVREYRGHEDFVLAVDYHPASQTLVTGCLDGSVCVWDARGTPAVRFVAAPGRASATARF